jgi:hypothetical protein
MDNEFTVISYNEDDLHLISIAQVHPNIFDIHAGTVDSIIPIIPIIPVIQDTVGTVNPVIPIIPIIQDTVGTVVPIIQDTVGTVNPVIPIIPIPIIQDTVGTIIPIIQDTVGTVDTIIPIIPVIQDIECKSDIVKLILKIGDYLSIDVFNKKVEYNPDVSLFVIFTAQTILNNEGSKEGKGDIIIDNNDINIPFQLTIIENNKIRYITIDSINYIIDNKSIGGVNNIIIKSSRYCDFMIKNDEFKQTIDNLYERINKSTPTIFTEEENKNHNIFNSIHMSFKMSNDDIITFIDNLLIDIDIKNIDFTVDKWYKTDFIIIRTLHDLFITLIKNILDNYKTVQGRYEQIKEIKYLMKICIKYYDNIKLLEKCCMRGAINLHNSIVKKSLEFYNSTNSIECFLCFAKYMPEYCNNNHYPVPLTKCKISAEYEKELLDDDNLRELYINNKHLL